MYKSWICENQYRIFKGGNPMKKRILIVLCLMGIMAVFAGCGNSNKELYTPQNLQEKQAKKVADKFVKRVQKKDYKDIRSYIYIPDNTFIKDEDVSWYLERSDLEDIVGMSHKQILLTSMEKDNTMINDSDNANASVKKLIYTIEDGTDYEIMLVQDKNNKWKIYMPDIYATDFKYIADKRLITYINGVKVTDNYIDETNGVAIGNYVAYDIPYVPNREFTISTSDGVKENVTSSDDSVQIDKIKK